MPRPKAVTAAIRIRRAIRGRLRLAVPLLIVATLQGGPQAAVGAEPPESPNLLDRPLADLAILGSPDPRTTPMLLVLEASLPPRSTARVTVLRRTDRWIHAASTDIDLGADDLSARWFVDLGEDRFALVATSPQSATGTGRAVVVGLAVDAQGGAVRIDELNRQVFDRAIEDAGAADVDGFGSAELVLGMRPFDGFESCGTSTLVVVDGTITAVRRSIDIPGPRGAGVLGQFDAVPGAELLLYTSPGCLPGGDLQSSLLSIRLADGSQSPVVAGDRHDFVTTLPPPLLVDVDGSAPDEVVATGVAGLAVFDPSRAWRSLVLAEGGSVPLVAGPTGQPELPGVRVALMEPSSARFLTARIRRDDGALVSSGRSELAMDAMDPSRWSILRTAIEWAGTHQAAPNAWIGDAFADGCLDVVLPGAIVPCESDDPRPGPAWLATRPIVALPVAGQRLFLVAAGLEWRPEMGLPASPTPAATGPAGWWRHGPSAPFAMSEIGADELARFDTAPIPAATIEAITTTNGDTDLEGSSGTRFFATVVPVVEGQERRLPSTDPFLALMTRPVPGSRTAVVRVPVPPGPGSGRAETVATLRIGDLVRPGDKPVGGWSIHAVPINDLGEWGEPVVRNVTVDDVAPAVTGNQTVGTVLILGGVDYRHFPWPSIIAVGLLALVAARWLFGGAPGPVNGVAGVGATRRASSAADDDPSMPVIEELPPGSGSARR